MPGGGRLFCKNSAGDSFAGLGTDWIVRSARRSSVKKRRPVPPSGAPASSVKMDTGISTLAPVSEITYRRHSVAWAKEVIEPIPSAAAIKKTAALHAYIPFQHNRTS